MINTRVYRDVSLSGSCISHSCGKPTQANLIHDGNAGILALLVELQHGRGDVAGGDNVLLLADGGLDDSGVEGVGDQADDKVVLGDLGVEGLVVGNIERDGSGILDAGRKSLSRLEGSAGCRAWSQWAS